MVVVRLATALRPHAGGAATLEIDVGPGPATLAAVLDAVEAAHPAVARRVRDESGLLRRHVNVFVGEERVRDLATVVPEGVEVAVLPAVSGG